MSYIINVEDLFSCDDGLICPYCGYDHLHHTQVEIFARVEDEEDVLYTRATQHETFVMKGPLIDNPSPRRHGLKVHFWCEGCSWNPVLDLFQHKGKTFLGWNKSD